MKDKRPRIQLGIPSFCRWKLDEGQEAEDPARDPNFRVGRGQCREKRMRTLSVTLIYERRQKTPASW